MYTPFVWYIYTHHNVSNLQEPEIFNLVSSMTRVHPGTACHLHGGDGSLIQRKRFHSPSEGVQALFDRKNMKNTQHEDFCLGV